jgi:hypothetical protein
VPRARGERWALDLLLLAGLGLAMAALGPYRTLDVPTLTRTAYWLAAVIGAGLVGIGIDTVLGPRVRGFWLRIGVVALAMTLPVTPFVYALNAVLLGLPRRPWLMPQLGGQVLVVALLMMAVRALAWRRIVETRTIVVPPLPEAERALRMRLSARRRTARLIALEAEDHYVRVHTDAGSELLSCAFRRRWKRSPWRTATGCIAPGGPLLMLSRACDGAGAAARRASAEDWSRR